MVFAVNGLSKEYGGRLVLDGISFTMDQGELVSLIGPSGVGKTTLLKILAGLERPTSGSVEFGDPEASARPPILVFQDYVLFPYLTVFQNVAFGLKAHRVPRKEIRERVLRMLAYFGIEEKASEYPARLSAGQKQRAAIARALVLQPSLLLLDEPFANLDRNLKMGTADFLRSTQKELGISMVCVTHDLEEAFFMSDRIGIILDGRLVQYGTVREVYFRPRTLEAARFLGPVNQLDPEEFRYLFPDARPRGASGEDGIYLRAEAIGILKDPAGPGIVRDVRFVGSAIHYTVGVGGHCLSIFGLENGIAPGDRVRLNLKEHEGYREHEEFRKRQEAGMRNEKTGAI